MRRSSNIPSTSQSAIVHSSEDESTLASLTGASLAPHIPSPPRLTNQLQPEITGENFTVIDNNSNAPANENLCPDPIRQLESRHYPEIDVEEDNYNFNAIPTSSSSAPSSSSHRENASSNTFARPITRRVVLPHNSTPPSTPPLLLYGSSPVRQNALNTMQARGRINNSLPSSTPVRHDGSSIPSVPGSRFYGNQRTLSHQPLESIVTPQPTYGYENRIETGRRDGATRHHRTIAGLSKYSNFRFNEPTHNTWVRGTRQVARPQMENVGRDGSRFGLPNQQTLAPTPSTPQRPVRHEQWARNSPSTSSVTPRKSSFMKYREQFGENSADEYYKLRPFTCYARGTPSIRVYSGEDCSEKKQFKDVLLQNLNWPSFEKDIATWMGNMKPFYIILPNQQDFDHDLTTPRTFICLPIDDFNALLEVQGTNNDQAYRQLIEFRDKVSEGLIESRMQNFFETKLNTPEPRRG
ncbi:hypothetical protein CAEBREN_11129 [Caenorhabditis brenneri]|uniref:Uncharacterized protein n=1 Tax=Caenorhabditis brenneri TaxID=135651 RepID=G0MSZ8_CAEBE|nr:hypothetical protein CAEBREN_11129 [Caenorhabditis brenneri]